MVIIIAGVLFYIYKDDLSKELLLSLNNIQKGEITLEDISFEPLALFPSISIGINNLTYFENRRINRDTSEIPIAEIDDIYAAINIIDLIGGKVNVSKITIDGGTLNIATYKDSSVNIFNALGLQKTAAPKKSNNSKSHETLNSPLSVTEDNKKNSGEGSGINLKFKELTLKNLLMNFKNEIFNRSSSYNIIELSSSFEYQPNLIKGDLSTDININVIKLANKTLLENEKLNIVSNFNFDREKLFVDVKQSQFSLGNTKFNFKGYYDIKNDEYVNLEVDGSDHYLSFFSLILSERGIKNLKSGDFYFHGTIRGKLSVGIPIAEFSFGVVDVNLQIPLANSSISNLNFNGHFNSGSKRNLSGAYLKLDTLYGKLPNGYVKGSFLAKNLVSPYLEFNYDVKSKLIGLDEIFKLDFIKNIGGSISIKDKVKGYYSYEEARIKGDINEAEITLDNVSFDLPGIIEIQSLDGIIHRDLDKLEFSDLKLLSGDTDLLINGEINNFLSLLTGDENSIDAKLNIKANTFDLPKFLSFDPTIGRDFPYKIKNLDLIVNATSTTTKLLEFDSFPEIDFNIKKLGATAEGFLPPLTINNGRFKVSENLLGFHMQFDHFLIDIAGGKLNLNGNYNSSKFQPFYIKTDVNLDRINPSKFIYDANTDSIPEIINGSLNGSLFAEVQFATDTMFMKLVNIKKGDLTYYFADDTIETKSLEFFTKDVYYNSDKNPNPLATLTTKLLIKSKEVITDYFKVDDVYYDIDADHGTYKVVPKSKSFFGSRGRGEHTLKPFDEVPNYRFKYTINQFKAEDLLTTFLEDTILTGKMDFSMDITMFGNQWDSLVSKLNGEIHLAGKDLIMYGVDSDELIEKFKRSQRFTLVDVGAVLLAGPVGIAVTKGTDYASIIVLNSGKETKVTNIVSDWTVHDGKLTVKDVAFATKKNRIAGKGWFNFATDSMDFTIALLNKNGCSIFSQDVFGSFSEPKTSKINVVNTILAPVTSLMEDIFGIDCKVFYTGVIKHPN